MVKKHASVRSMRKIPWSRRLFPVFFAVVFLIVSVPIITYAIFARELETKERLMNFNDAGVVLLDRHNEPFFTFYSAKPKEYASLKHVPRHTQLAIIAIEDKDFYNHPGFSLKGIIRSFYVNVVQRDLAQGGSTLTQQLVKNSLLNPQKNFLRKYQEIVLAEEIERRYTKSEILEMYLNSVYFGEGAFGIESAAEVYFGKSAQDLTLAQSAFLAGILPAPSAYSPFSGDVQKAKVRQRLVLEAMRSEKYITSKDYEKAVKESLFFTQERQVLNAHAPHLALMVKQELLKRFGEERVVRSGFRVKTTLDLEWQQFAEKTVKEQVERLAQNNATNGAAVVIDPDNGAVRVLVGSKDWYDEQNGKVNMALSPRQPGSAFKPLVYATALEKRIITPGSILKDVPTTFEGNYKPNNYDRKFRGQVLARKALAMSLNIPTVEVMTAIGVIPMLEKAKEYGLSTLKEPSQYGASLSLGTAEIPLIELTEAYTVFANDGVRHEYFFIDSIEDKTGTIIYQHSSDPVKVIEPTVAFLLSSMLSDANARAEAFGNALTISRPAAVKTGTTELYRDALTVGYTPSLVVGVWVGNNDNTGMDAVAGALGAAPIWRSLMEQYLQDTPVEPFAPPRGITATTICSANGLRSLRGGNGTYQEYYISGTEPTQICVPPKPTEDPKKPSDTPQPQKPEDQKPEKKEKD